MRTCNAKDTESLMIDSLNNKMYTNRNNVIHDVCKLKGNNTINISKYNENDMSKCTFSGSRPF